jgi:hypothetical protein
MNPPRLNGGERIEMNIPANTVKLGLPFETAFLDEMRRVGIKSLTTAVESIRSSGQALLRGKRLMTSHFLVVRSNITGPATMEIAPKKLAANCPSAVATTQTRPQTSPAIAIRGPHAAAPAYAAMNTAKAAAEPAAPAHNPSTAKIALLLAPRSALLSVLFFALRLDRRVDIRFATRFALRFSSSTRSS